MKLYQEHNVNPAAGCFPMILQLFIIWPLFRAISGLKDIMAPEEATFLWIGNLTEGSLATPDITLIIINVIAMIGQTYLTQKWTGNNSQNNAIMWVMPFIILWFGFKLPAGVLLYWLTQTVLTVIQQYIIYQDPEMKGAVGE